jgi:hypothetical protein
MLKTAHLRERAQKWLALHGLRGILYINQSLTLETKDLLSRHLGTSPLRHPASTSRHPVALGCDKGYGSPSDSRDRSSQTEPQHGGTPEYLGLSPAENVATLLEQTRAFSRAVNQLQADMEQSIGKPTSPAWVGTVGLC